MDIGSSHFQAASFRHAGYNVGVANLGERPLALGRDGYRIASTGEPPPPVPLPCLRLERAGEAVRSALADSYEHLVQDDSVLLQLCKEYARRPVLLRAEPPAGPALPVRDRHAWAGHLATAAPCLRQGVAGAATVRLPSPFVPSEAAAYERWRRRAWRPIARGLLAEGAKCVRIVLPEEYDRVKKRFPALAGTAQRPLRRRHRQLGLSGRLTGGASARTGRRPGPATGRRLPTPRPLRAPRGRSRRSCAR